MDKSKILTVEIGREWRQNCQWLVAMLQNIGHGVIATDRQGCIKFMNPAAETLTGWGQAEVLGQPSTIVLRLINSKTRQALVNPIDRALHEGQVVELGDNTLLITRSKTEIPIDDNTAPVWDDQGNIDGAVLVFRDIAERKHAEEKLRQFVLEVQAQNAELDVFAHNLAHDLKSPLNPIIGFSQILLTDHANLSSAEVEEFLEIITRNARKMTSLIDELLLLAELHRSEIQVKPLQMATIVAQVQQRLGYLIEQYQAELILPQSWPTALGSSAWVEEVWVKYISNGLKQGGRPPRLELGAAKQADGQVRFWVQDNGPGLTAPDQAALFVPFTQLKQLRATDHGLGLSIVGWIIERLGGHVGVESDGVPGLGTRFYFTLPGVTYQPACDRSNGHSQRFLALE